MPRARGSALKMKAFWAKRKRRQNSHGMALTLPALSIQAVKAEASFVNAALERGLRQADRREVTKQNDVVL